MSFITSDINAPFAELRNYRPDIDGLKALAVLAVIAFHYFGPPLTGGFTGVDVFFVISGYLIGRSTFIELKLKTFSLGKYFARRAKRIFPSLIVLLLCLWLASLIILLPDERASLGKHIGAASVFISNWLLWREIGYFDLAAELKPLLNLWSLGVEEQFYLIFPLLVYICIYILRGQIFLGLFALAIGLLVLSELRLVDNAGWAYYHPASRLWELLLGALLAYIELHRLSKSISINHVAEANASYWQHLASLAGATLLIYTGLFYSKATSFPGAMALTPVFGAILIIAAGKNAWFNRYVLSQRALIYIGLISYPLYLWHWPLITMVKVVDGEHLPIWITVLCLALTFAISAACYHFLERPIRFGRFSKRSYLPAWLWAGLLLLGVIGFATFQYSKEPKATTTGPSIVTPVTDSKPGLVVVIGNSHAEVLKESLEQYFGADGKRVETFYQGGCIPFWNLGRHDPGHNPQDCAKDINRGISHAISSEAELVVFAAFFENPSTLYDITNPSSDRVGNGLTPDMGHNWSLFTESLDQTLAMLTQANKKVIFIENVPALSFDPKECTKRPVRFSSRLKDPCVVSRSQVEKDQTTYRQILKDAASKYPSVTIFDPLPAFCDDQYCYAKDSTGILYKDRNHLSDEGLKRLYPYLKLRQ